MAKRKQPEPEGPKSKFRVEPPATASGYKTGRHVLTLLLNSEADAPVISFHPDGERTYLWIGDDEGGCYGVTDGIEPLREFARALLTATEPKPK